MGEATSIAFVSGRMNGRMEVYQWEKGAAQLKCLISKVELKMGVRRSYHWGNALHMHM